MEIVLLALVGIFLIPLLIPVGISVGIGLLFVLITEAILLFLKALGG